LRAARSLPPGRVVQPLKVLSHRDLGLAGIAAVHRQSLRPPVFEQRHDHFPLVDLGVLVPNTKLRPLVVPKGPEVPDRAIEASVASAGDTETARARPAPHQLGASAQRVSNIDMKHRPNSGAGEFKVIANIPCRGCHTDLPRS
jgi:hypothetical protein